MLSRKSQYALRVILDIAYYSRSGVVQRRQIIQRQNVPEDFLDCILARFKEEGLIASLRGREGGYYLAKDPESIMVADVLKVSEAEEAFKPWDNIDIITSMSFNYLHEACVKNLSKISIEDLLQKSENDLMLQKVYYNFNVLNMDITPKRHARAQI